MEKIRIQDDLYKHVNQEWLDSAVIPDDKPTTGSFALLDKQVEEKMISLFNDMESGAVSIPNDYLRRAIELFSKAKDIKRRNNEGIRPVLKRLGNIRKLSDVASFNRHLADFVLENYPLPFDISVDVDMKDSNVHSIFVSGPRVILPDTTYYLEENKEQHDQLLAVWTNMVTELLTYTRLSADDQTKYIEDAIKFDAILSKLVKSSEEWSDYTSIYNPVKLRTFASMVKPVKIRKLFVSLFGENLPDVVIVAEPRYFKAFGEVLNDETFELYKHWAYIMELTSATSYLSVKLRKIGARYSSALSGVKELPTIEKQAYKLASSVYAEPVGKYYGEEYFGEKAKKDVYDIVYEIIETYKKRIASNEFLTEQTKQKAIVKLSAINVKMGYPDSVDSFYDHLIFNEESSLFGAMCEIAKLRTKHNFDKLTQPVDKSKWVMAGHIVNACYDPTSNDITFPAAILQQPFYSINQSRSENLGGIGAVVGHEISHAFDNNGAKYDENGVLKNWWTSEDFKKFNARTKAMIKQFDGIELEWGKVNGTFVVSENIADNGGMAVTLEIMSTMPEADYKQYFINWARVWRLKGRPEYLNMLLAVDVHAPAYLRGNMPPKNFEEFYQAFDVKSSDGMYLPPKKRIHIW